MPILPAPVFKYRAFALLTSSAGARDGKQAFLGPMASRAADGRKLFDRDIDAPIPTASRDAGVSGLQRAGTVQAIHIEPALAG